MSSTERVTDGEWAVGVSVLLLGTGILTGSPVLVGLAAMPLGFVAAAGFDTAPEPSVTLERAFDPEGGPTTTEGGLQGNPGERVTVQLTVHNTGTEPLADLRLVDGVPSELPVVAGTHRAAVTLGPGEQESIEYELELRRGEYAFDAVEVQSEGFGGTVLHTETTTAEGAQALRCLPFVEEVPLGEGANDYAGQIPTDEGGSGVEFYSVRDYEPGDPVRSIDWRRYANSRELATVEFRAERATRVVCLVDSRQSQRRAQSTDHLPALDLSVAAAEQTFDAVVDAGYPIGVVGIKNRSQLVVEPGEDAMTRQRGSELLAALRSHETSKHAQSHWGEPTATVPTLLPGEAQIVLFSSFVDDIPLALVKRLCVHGYPVCVVSPDVASDREDTAGRLAAVARRTRLATARQAGARVVDWDAGDSIGTVLKRVVTEVSSR